MAWIGEEIETARLILRPALDGDKASLAAMIADPGAQRYLGGPVSQAHIDGLMASTVGERWGSFIAALPATDEVVGTVSFGDERGELEISYQLLPTFWRQGFGSEATRAALEWAWQNTDAASIIAVTQTANTASVALLHALGFVLERDFEEFDAMQAQYRLSRPA